MTQRYYVSIVAITDEDEFDYDTYAEEWRIIAEPMQLGQIVAMLSLIESDMPVSPFFDAMGLAEITRKLENLGTP